MENKLFDNNFDEIEYGQEKLRGTGIAISPFVSNQYEETTTESIEDVYLRRKIMERLWILYKPSPFHLKYGDIPKKIERADLSDLYYYFKDLLLADGEYTIVQIFCAIAEFFDLNYKVMYNDIISLSDKAKLLELLSDQFGLDKEFNNAQKLF